jgi:PPE-repeat protein
VDFSVLPPEVISGLIHSGPGAESLIEASGAWRRLGTHLEELASINGAALSSLIEAWQGPSAVAMTQAVAPYLIWLRTTAQQCQQIASSALAAVTAFNSAQTSVVPVAQVVANRARLARLLATNMFGVNLPAIAATEDEYQGMWANNSAAMSRYQTASAQATTLPQFSSPPPIASPTAAAQASAATAAAASTPAAPTLGSIFNIFAPGSNTSATGLPGLLNLFSGSTGSSFGSFWNSNLVGPAIINSIGGAGYPINLLSYLAQNTAAQALQNVGGDIGTGLSEGQAALGAGPEALGALGAAGLSAEPTAAIGVGVSMGNLTMPAAVVGLLPASQAPVQLAAAVSPLPSGESGFPFVPPLMPPPISAGSGWRKRKQQKLGSYEEPEDEEDEEYQEPAGLNPSSPDSPGSGWRKRGKDYDEIEYGAELRGTVMHKPPSAG